ncbi:hypothetical protein [Wolbachia endosymbiont (group A) of Agelastica alni]|uniref:hypothetical protein n=1 Tax=Wolbachia endosymbiont (group A) of Agelastica alni TaxID=3066130 RepID=UPI0031334A37
MLPHSKTINIEGTKFKYEIHYDQLNDKDLLTIEKYANHIFHAYHEKHGLDMNTDYTFKGFIYNSLTDLRNARPGHNTAYAGASFHHYPYKSGSIAHDLTEAIYVTLNFYNKQSRDIPIPKGNFRIDVPKELKAIKLDDNQKESNTAEKPETTINQEKQKESKKVEPSGSEEDEKIKLDEAKSSQKEISTETVLPDLNNSDNNQKESNTAEKPETTINQEKQEESKKVESSGSEEDEKIKLDEAKSSQEKISTEKHKVVLPHSKTINIEGTKFKYEIHYDQSDEKDLLMIEKYANHIFHAYQERYGLDMNTDHTVKGFIYNNLADLSDDAYHFITADYHEYHYHSKSIANDLTTMIYSTLNLYTQKNYATSFPRGNFIRDVVKELEEKSCQEEISTETMLPHSKIINIEGTKFKLKVHYDQLDDKDLLTIEARANSIFHAYPERNGLDMNKDYTFDTNVYNNYLSDGDSYLQEVLENQIYYSLAKAGYDMY